MYCVKCGVKLEDSEKKCPLCETVVYHPDIKQPEAKSLYPKDKRPKARPVSRAFNGATLILFFIPALVSLISDWQTDGILSWFGYVAGAMTLAYIMIGLPLWFRNPNPVIFVPCSFAGLAAYLLYIDLATGPGYWFLTFALPVVAGICLIVTAVVTLLRYLKKGRLYIWGGAFVAFGAMMPLIETLLVITFELPRVDWYFYPMIVFCLLGGALIYLAINRSAREIMERKLFF